MACRFEVTLPGERSDQLDAAHAALDMANALEDQLTIFRDTSELATINRDAALGPVTIEDRLYDLLRLAQRLSRETDGAFDITSTPLSRIWGFLRRAGRLPAPEEIEEARQVVGMNKVELGLRANPSTETESGTTPLKTIRFRQPGVSLNLGGIGKGYALDRMAEGLKETGVETALLSAGASSFRALGYGPDGAGFEIGIRDPVDHGRRFGTLRLGDSALGVSGSGEQFFEVEGRRLGHIIDPRTGWPVEGQALVAVVAPTATVADALATAFYVGGPALAERYTQRHRDVSVVILGMPLQGRSDAIVFGRDAEWRMNRAA